MSDLIQTVSVVRSDWRPLLKKAEAVIHEVMTAGERQRLAAGKDPNAWLSANSKDRLRHVLLHLLACHHYNNPLLLAHDTQIEQIKHALVGILIILVNEDQELPNSHIVKLEVIEE